MDQILIQVRFTENAAKGTYSDALYFTQEEYATKSEADIQALKDARVAAFEAIVKAPAVEPTKEQLELEASDLQSRLDEVNQKIAEAK